MRNQPVRTEFFRHEKVLHHQRDEPTPIINLIKTGTLTVNSTNLKIFIPIKRGPNQT